ncbi:hypothetical protein QEN19_003421 [Hanseniaspora menglaensis]
MVRVFSKVIDYIFIPSAGLITGLSFIKPWPDMKSLDFSHHETKLIENESVLKDLKTHLSDKYQDNDAVSFSKQSQLIPKQHSLNHVGISLFRHQDRICIDPLLVRHTNSEEFDNIELSCYFHLGEQLLNQVDKTTYKGALTLIMDEVLCITGFPKLPNKKGVTASLEIEFMEDKIPIDQLLVLNCKIQEQRGRKCITNCELLKVENTKKENCITSIWSKWTGLKSETTPLAKGMCVLVEPKWFKYFGWLDVFSDEN